MDRESDVLDFLASSLASVWALEALLHLKASARSWTKEELVAELRGSDSAVGQALKLLRDAGLVLESAERYAYRPLSPELREMIDGLADLYQRKPVTVFSAIAGAPRRKLQMLSDAFRLKKD
jgi:hypothetical protein